MGAVKSAVRAVGDGWGQMGGRGVDGWENLHVQTPIDVKVSVGSV